MTINTNYHTLSGTDIAEDSQDELYKEYRHKWHSNPKEYIVSDFPLFLDIEATSVCNLKCPHCVQTHVDFDRGFMELDIFERIIDEASENGCYGCKFHTIGRGEPLLHKDIVKMVAYAKKKGLIDVYINTNAMLLDEGMSKGLLDAGLDRIAFSIDAYDRQLYEAYRPGANFQKVLRNITKFLTFRDKGKYVAKGEWERHNTKIRIQTVELPMIDLHLYREIWQPYCDEVAYIDYKEMRERTYGLRGKWVCPQPWQRMSVLWNGLILPCNHDDRCFALLGNVGNTTVGKAWRSSAMNFFRSAHIKGNAHFLAACDGCYLRTSEVRKEE